MYREYEFSARSMFFSLSFFFLFFSSPISIRVLIMDIVYACMQKCCVNVCVCFKCVCVYVYAHKVQAIVIDMKPS